MVFRTQLSKHKGQTKHRFQNTNEDLHVSFWKLCFVLCLFRWLADVFFILCFYLISISKNKNLRLKPRGSIQLSEYKNPSKPGLAKQKIKRVVFWKLFFVLCLVFVFFAFCFSALAALIVERSNFGGREGTAVNTDFIDRTREIV